MGLRSRLRRTAQCRPDGDSRFQGVSVPLAATQLVPGRPAKLDPGIATSAATPLLEACTPRRENALPWDHFVTKNSTPANGTFAVRECSARLATHAYEAESASCWTPMTPA